VRDRLTEFGEATTVALIIFTDARNLTAYTKRNEFPFPVLVDPDRSTYRAFGLGRGTVWRVWGIKAAMRYLQILVTNGLSGLRRPTEDTLQLGGDFIISSDGTLAYGFWGDGPDDRPSVDQLVDAVRRIEA